MLNNLDKVEDYSIINETLMDINKKFINKITDDPRSKNFSEKIHKFEIYKKKWILEFSTFFYICLFN